MNLRGPAGPHAFSSIISALATAASGLFFLGLLVSWFVQPLGPALIEDRPGQDNRPAGTTVKAESSRIGEYFQKYSGRPAADKSAWPRFRGPAADNISRERLSLASPFTVKPLWSVSVGEGHAAPVVSDGRVFLLDYDEARQSDALRCLSLETGQEIWRRWYSVPLKRNHGISRSIPAVSSGFVVTMGPAGHVMCVRAETGGLLWGIDVVREYKSEVPQWYTAQCPLIDAGEAVIAAVGTSFMIGVDLKTGKVRWKTPAVTGLGLSHSSVMPAAIAGKRVFLYSGLGGLAGVSAEKGSRGRLLFLHREWDNAVVAPSPVSLGDGRIFLTAGYGAGSMLMKVEPASPAWKTSTLARYRPKEALACEQQTPIFHQGLLFGVMPKDAGEHKSRFVCWDPDARRFLWSTGKELTFGLGPFLLADGRFLILSETGVLTLLEADRQGFRVLGRTEAIPKAIDAWGPMALVGRRLLLRDSRRLFAVELQ